ncbi:hypothetical protein EDD86DRAFT_208758 [Gorgonomyces haynaldii]|nr:hypothetical protein EDD86DRAFT_208758 [Gorgonomyces haynaldii]
MTLPVELWIHVCEYLPQRDLFEMLRVNKTTNQAALTSIWRMIKISPKVTLEQWKQLIDTLETERGLQYLRWVREVHDVWLYVGGEQEDKPFCDSAVDLVAPRYSLHHCLDMLFQRARIRILNLHFYSETMLHLPWTALHDLEHLNLGMRITDSILSHILTHETKIKQLVLGRAEISDQSLELIRKYCPSLVHLEVKMVPFHERSRYHMAVDPTTRLPITDAGMLSVLQLKHLRSLKMKNAQDVSAQVFLVSEQKLEHLTLTVSSMKGMSLEQCLMVFDHFASTLKDMRLVGNLGTDKEPGILSDRIIPEETLLSLPLRYNLERITLEKLDFSKIKQGCTQFYGSRDMPWEVDKLRREFHALFPTVDLQLVY